MDTIIALHRNDSGEIISFQTSSGRIISYRKALMEAESGQLNGVVVAFHTDGRRTLSPEGEGSFEEFPQIY
jgi:hypothetical protein